MFDPDPSPCFDPTCERHNFSLASASDLVEHIARRVAQERLTRAVFSAWEKAAPGTASLVQDYRDFIRLAFHPWGEERIRLGDLSEELFFWLREAVGQGIVFTQKKREALSSATPGWDLLEIRLNPVGAGYSVILWEIKGTDANVVSQSRKACQQLKERAHEWLVKLSVLLEGQLLIVNPALAAFCADLHRLAYREEEEFHVGVALITDRSGTPAEPFSAFGPGAILTSAKRHAVMLRVGEYATLRKEVEQWILG